MGIFIECVRLTESGVRRVGPIKVLIGERSESGFPISLLRKGGAGCGATLAASESKL